MTDPSAIRKLIESVTEGLAVAEWGHVDAGDGYCCPHCMLPRDTDLRAPVFREAPHKPGCKVGQAIANVPQLLDEVERLNIEMDVMSDLLTGECQQNATLRARIAELEAGVGERK